MSHRKRRALVSAPYMQPVLSRFTQFFADHDIEVVVPPVRERLEEDELLAWIEDIDGVICGDDRFTERVLNKAKRLKVISKWGTGIDSIDQACCARLGIAVRNTPNAFTRPVADSVLGYILCFARQIPWLHRIVASSEWSKLAGRALGECTLGIVGVGNIGRAVASRAAAFGMTLLGNDIRAIPEEVLAGTGMRAVDLETLLRESDFVSVNCDLNPTSFHLINAPRLALMRPQAVLVNTARGPIVDEVALVEALEAGTIAGAALDVFEIEPLPLNSRLRSLPNVLLAAHASNASPRAWEHVHDRTLANLVEELDR
ncbi:MAG: phosphoglycerate dehydrogenase [Candidatus Schekmanbacteria bacterium]|nr:phosphoglycerate dehydrogenase [Candidatus Schekmanbacteria bacterium]